MANKINIGSINVGTAKLGTSDVKLYLGDNLVYPIIPQYKLVANYSDSSTYSSECDANTLLRSGDTKPSGYEYSAMTDAVVGDCIVQIADNAFTDCISLSSVTLSDSLGVGAVGVGIGSSAFRNCSGLTSIDIPSGVTKISSYSFYNCKSLSSVTADNVTTIDSNAFDYCSGLQSISLPNVKIIRNYAFEYCGLTSISMPSLEYIYEGAFNGCRFVNLTLPNSLIQIFKYGFMNNQYLTSVTLGNNISSIGVEAFSNCRALTTVTINRTTPPSLSSNVFQGAALTAIYVPSESVESYKTASRWSDYENIIQAIPNS